MLVETRAMEAKAIKANQYRVNPPTPPSSMTDESTLFHPYNNCYAEPHVSARLGARVASMATFRDVGVNTDPLLTAEEQRVLRLLDEQAASWVASSSSSSSSMVATATSAAKNELILRPPQNPPFTPEVPVSVLLDALWCTRYRPRLLILHEVRRQRAALIAAKRNRRLQQQQQQASAAAAATTPGSTHLVVAASSPAVAGLSPTLSFSATLGANLSFASSMDFGGGGSTVAGDANIPSDEDVPLRFPLDSIRNVFDSMKATNINIRSLAPDARGAPPSKSILSREDDDDDDSSASMAASSASSGVIVYVGRELVCQCFLDLLPLCPNVTEVSLHNHHASNETLLHLASLAMGEKAEDASTTSSSVKRNAASSNKVPPHAQVHPRLSNIDLRGNVLEVPVAKAFAAALRSNPRLTTVSLDDRCLLLPTTRRKLECLISENQAKMHTVRTLRTEWTQTTLLPDDLQQDVATYVDHWRQQQQQQQQQRPLEEL